jgi:hypothetical protein
MGADINMKTGYYGSAVQAARELGYEEVGEMLVNEGAILE